MFESLFAEAYFWNPDLRASLALGYLRWWPIDEVDSAEADYDNGILECPLRFRASKEMLWTGTHVRVPFLS